MTYKSSQSQIKCLYIKKSILVKKKNKSRTFAIGKRIYNTVAIVDWNSNVGSEFPRAPWYFWKINGQQPLVKAVGSLRKKVERQKACLASLIFFYFTYFTLYIWRGNFWEKLNRIRWRRNFLTRAYILATRCRAQSCGTTTIKALTPGQPRPSRANKQRQWWGMSHIFIWRAHPVCGQLLNCTPKVLQDRPWEMIFFLEIFKRGAHQQHHRKSSFCHHGYSALPVPSGELKA